MIYIGFPADLKRRRWPEGIHVARMAVAATPETAARGSVLVVGAPRA
jgi:hypothetical protein